MAACKMAHVFGCASGFIHVFVYVMCCASVFATDLSGVISLRIYDRHALLAIKSAMDNFQSQRNEVVFHLFCTQFTSILASQLVVASEVSLEEAGVGFFVLLRQLRREVDLLELHYWAAAGKIRLRLVGAGLIPSSPYVYYLGCHLKARKATAHCSRNPDLLCAELLINS